MKLNVLKMESYYKGLLSKEQRPTWRIQRVLICPLQEVGNWGFEEHCYVHGLGIAAQCETIEAPLVGRIVVLLTSLCFTRPHKSHSSVSFCQKAMEKVQMSHYFYTHWTKINSNLFKFLLPGSTIQNQQIMEPFLKSITLYYFSIFIAY